MGKRTSRKVSKPLGRSVPKIDVSPDAPEALPGNVDPNDRAAVDRAVEATDRSLIDLMNNRARLVQSQSVASDDEGAAALVSRFQRDQEWVTRHNSGPLADAVLHAVLRDLDGAIRTTLRPVRVAYLGPEYSFSHLAAIERFGTHAGAGAGAELVPVGTIGAVFEEVHRDGADLGVVPIENSTDGRIVDTLEMFVQLPVKICGEVPLRIHHHLWGSGPREGIREVCSKPQALSQCRNWLATHLPDARLVPVSSTAAAAEMAAARPDVAAIASAPAGVHYGLREIASRIEDNPDNVTRFVILGAEPAPRTGRDKTSLMFELPHQPGALADAMVIFKRQQLNLTWIESFPKRHSPREYWFFVELEGHPREARVRRALVDLKRKAVRVEVLGAYARASVAG